MDLYRRVRRAIALAWVGAKSERHGDRRQAAQAPIARRRVGRDRRPRQRRRDQRFGTVARGLVVAALAALAVLAIAAPARAADLPEPASSVTVLTGAGISMSDQTQAWPLARIGVDAPIFLGHDRAIGRLDVTLTLAGLPGDTLDLARVETYKALELSAAYKRRIGASGDGSSSTYVVGRSGFLTRVLPSDPAPRDRYARVYGAGVRAEHRDQGEVTRAIEVIYGRSEVASPDMYHGQLVVSGHVKVVDVKGVSLVIGADAHLNLGKRDASAYYYGAARPRDVARVWVSVGRP